MEPADADAPPPEPPKKASKKPADTAITQQTLWAWRPVLEPIWVVLIFLAICIILIPIGGACLFFGLQAVELRFRYDNYAQCANGTTNAQRADVIRAGGQTCNFSMEVKHTMEPPIYVYYELSGYHQNHRRYVKSRSDLQLAGQNSAGASECKPQLYYKGDQSKPIIPCGLIAWSFFNDTYSFALNSSGNSIQPLVVSDKGIAYDSDRNDRFSSTLHPSFFNNDTALRGGATLDPSQPLASNERFIVWMRISPLPTFRKLWGKIDKKLNKGDIITVNIENLYNTYTFNGHKTIVLGTTTWLGGRNPLLGVVFVVTGGCSALLACVYLALYMLNRRNFGDLNLASWNRK